MLLNHWLRSWTENFGRGPSRRRRQRWAAHHTALCGIEKLEDRTLLSTIAGPATVIEGDPYTLRTHANAASSCSPDCVGAWTATPS